MNSFEAHLRIINHQMSAQILKMNPFFRKGVSAFIKMINLGKMYIFTIGYLTE
jgi:hypothetical protein